MQQKQTATTGEKQISCVLENHFILCCIFSGKDSEQG